MSVNFTTYHVDKNGATIQPITLYSSYMQFSCGHDILTSLYVAQLLFSLSQTHTIWTIL